LLKFLTGDCKRVAGGLMNAETDPVKAVDDILSHIEDNRRKLNI